MVEYEVTKDFDEKQKEVFNAALNHIRDKKIGLLNQNEILLYNKNGKFIPQDIIFQIFDAFAEDESNWPLFCAQSWEANM